MAGFGEACPSLVGDAPGDPRNCSVNDEHGVERGGSSAYGPSVGANVHLWGHATYPKLVLAVGSLPLIPPVYPYWREQA